MRITRHIMSKKRLAAVSRIAVEFTRVFVLSGSISQI